MFVDQLCWPLNPHGWFERHCTDTHKCVLLSNALGTSRVSDQGCGLSRGCGSEMHGRKNRSTDTGDKDVYGLKFLDHLKPMRTSYVTFILRDSLFSNNTASGISRFLLEF